MNNFEKIKAMDIDEMAEKIWTYTVWSCDFCVGADCPERQNDSFEKLNRYTPNPTSYKEYLLKFIAKHLVEILFELRMFRHNIDK